MLIQLHPSPATKQVTVAVPESQVLGVDVNTLQEVEINDNKVTGTSKYVESFPQFDKDAKGNFLALKCEEATRGDTVEWELSEAQSKGSGTLDSDGILVVQLYSNTQTVTFKNGETSKKLDLTGVTLAQKSMPVRTVTEIKAQLDKLGIEYDKKATKADLLTLLPQKG